MVSATKDPEECVNAEQFISHTKMDEFQTNFELHAQLLRLELAKPVVYAMLEQLRTQAASTELKLKRLSHKHMLVVFPSGPKEFSTREQLIVQSSGTEEK